MKHHSTDSLCFRLKRVVQEELLKQRDPIRAEIVERDVYRRRVIEDREHLRGRRRILRPVGHRRPVRVQIVHEVDEGVKLDRRVSRQVGSVQLRIDVNGALQSGLDRCHSPIPRRAPPS